jgi:hypothetical protein
MITSDSRYVNASHESAITHTYDPSGITEASPSDVTVPNELNKETTYMLTTAQSTPPPKQYMVKETDNIQLLAFKALQDPTRWWVIANANPHIRYPLDLKAGDMIHLPE